jgi:hypothetical protein
MKTAPRDERNLDSARRRLDQRLAVRVRQPSPAVEERSIDVDREQANEGGR